MVSGFVGACPIENDTLNLLVYPFPEAPEISGDSVVCEGAPLVLSTPSGETVQYQWSGPTGFYPSADSIMEEAVTLDNDGIYTLVINDHGCLSPPTLWDVEVPATILNISMLATPHGAKAKTSPCLFRSVAPTWRRSGHGQPTGHPSQQQPTRRLRLVYRARRGRTVPDSPG